MANKYNDVAAVWGGDRQRGRTSVWPSGQWQGMSIAAYYEADGEYERIRASDEDVLRQVGVIAADWASTA